MAETGEGWSDDLFLLVFPNLRDLLGKGLANEVDHIYAWLKGKYQKEIFWAT